MRRLALGFILLGSLIPGVSFALGLGEIRVDSALNQPLQARIDLLGTSPAEVESMRVRLAPEEVFARVGIDRAFYLSDLEFTPKMQDGQAVIAVTTKRGMREPFLNFLIEVSWPKGRLVREYTILLDPPIYMDQQPASVATQLPEALPAEQPLPPPMPAPVVEPTPVPVPAAEPEAAAAAPQPMAEPSPEPLPLPMPVPSAADMREPGPVAEVEADELFPRIPLDEVVTAESVEVKRGDTLWVIANRSRPEGVSVNQMMVALLRANPAAFIDNNINNLKRGYVLRMPSREEIDGVDRRDANLAVKEQNALWREYRARFAGHAVPQEVGGIAQEVPAEPLAAESAAPAAEAAAGRVELLGTGAGQAGEGAATPEEEVALVRQALEARRQENQELLARVGELQQLVADKDRLIELKNQELAELQARLGGEPPAAPAGIAPAAEAPAAAAEQAPVEPVASDQAEPQPAAEPPQGETAVPAEPAPEGEPKAEAAAAPAEVAGPKLTPPEPVAQTGFVQDLLASPNGMFIVGSLALLVLAVIWLAVRRLAKKGKAAMEGPGAGAALAAGAAGGAAAAVAAKPAAPKEVPEAVAAPAAAPAMKPLAFEEPGLEAEAPQGEIESDDTTAEADVYLAYGLHQQAEDLLRGALRDRPEKDIYRLKLLETYFATKNTAAFDSMAQELKQRLGGEGGVLWERAVAMGKELNPGNALFSGAGAGAGAGVSVRDFVARKPQATDIDLDFGAEEPALDLGLSEPSGKASKADDELDIGLDLDLESTQVFEAPVLGAPEESTVDLEDKVSPVDETAEVELDLGDFDLGEPEFNEPTAVVADRPEETVDISFELDETADLDLDTASSELETDEVPLAATDQTMEFDVGDLGDLDAGFGGNEPTDLNRQLGEDDLAPMDEDEGMISAGDEVSTKLDLAKAYIDMGDSEGARSTLEEIIAEGNEQQRREAKELMQQIA